MSDLARSQAQWTAIGRRLGWWLRQGRVLLEMRDRFREERIQIIESDPNTNSGGGATLSGVVYGTSTSEDGKIFCRVSGSGPYTIDGYKATGGGAGDKVFTSASGAAGATVALSEANSSGVSGSFTFDGSVSADTTDTHILEVFIDSRKQASDLWDGSETITGDDSYALSEALGACEAIADAMDGALSSLLSAFDAWALGSAANELGQLAEWHKDASGTILSEQASNDGSGSISRLRTGLLERIRQNMVDESTAAQKIVHRVTAATAATAGTSNQGAATVTITVDQHTPAGRYELTCKGGLGTGAGGSETFELAAVLDDDTRKVHTQRATIGQSYQGEDGVTVTLARSATKTGDGSHVVLGNPAAGAFTFIGESESNTSSGVLNWVTTASSVVFYSSSSIIDANKVAEATGLSGAGSSFTATQKNNSGLTVVGTLGSTPGAGSGTIDLKFNSTSNTQDIPDIYEFTVSETSSGKGARLLQKLFGYKLNGAASGETLDEGFLGQQGTFPSYTVEDN